MLGTAGETPALQILGVPRFCAIPILGSQGEDKLQFEVNGEDYFLNFVEDERRWFVFAPTPTGLQRIPVYIDGSDYERIGILERDRQKRPN
jgi:hypothetical protein